MTLPSLRDIRIKQAAGIVIVVYALLISGTAQGQSDCTTPSDKVDVCRSCGLIGCTSDMMSYPWSTLNAPSRTMTDMDSGTSTINISTGCNLGASCVTSGAKCGDNGGCQVNQLKVTGSCGGKQVTDAFTACCGVNI